MRKNTTSSGISQLSKESKKELTAQWRFLKKVGAYNTKETAAEMRLTKYRVKEITRRFREIQDEMAEVKHGRTVRPIFMREKKTKRGKSIIFDLLPQFKFIRTKKKTPIKKGALQTKKGVIVRKSNKDAKIGIDKKGNIIEYVGNTRRIKRHYTGKQLLDLLDKIEAGKYKWKKNEIITFHKFGNPFLTISGRDDVIDLIRSYIQNVQARWGEKEKENFNKASYLEFIKDYGDDFN